jgi:signal transduction histidine kinase
MQDKVNNTFEQGLAPELLSMAAHQLKIPLTGNKWALEALRDGDYGELSESQRQIVDKICEGNAHAILLVDDVLMSEMGQKTVFELRTTSTSLVGLVEEVILELRSEAQRRNIDVTLIQPAEPISQVEVDPQKMRYVLENVISNSLHYTDDGGSVEVNIIDSAEDVVVSVRDTGIGIPEEEWDKIFGKFYRAHNIKTKQVGGTGLGLFISKNIVERHGGKIWFESAEGVGTTFHISIPVTKGV